MFNLLGTQNYVLLNYTPPHRQYYRQRFCYPGTPGILGVQNPTQDFSLVWLDQALFQPRGQILEQFAGQLMVIIRSLIMLSIAIQPAKELLTGQ